MLLGTEVVIADVNADHESDAYCQSEEKCLHGNVLLLFCDTDIDRKEKPQREFPKKPTLGLGSRPGD